MHTNDIVVSKTVTFDKSVFALPLVKKVLVAVDQAEGFRLEAKLSD